jgi:hypothetical protein
MPRWFNVVVACGGFVILVGIAVAWLPLPSKQQPQWGVTFNRAYAEYLGLDWQQVFIATRDELGVQRWRLSVPWDEIESKPGILDFAATDWMLDKVEQTGGKVVLAIGRRTPRWPECHDPIWLASMDSTAQRNATLAYLAAIVQRYAGREVITAWQVENEMNLDVFGECPPSDLSFYEQEVALVRSLDTARRPVTTSVSGELSRWGKLAKEVDQIGTSVYRTTYNPLWGYFTYPYPALFYQMRARLTEARTNTAVYISELQMEPWGRLPLVKLPVKEQLSHMGPRERQRNIYLARQTGLDPVYLWGVEWWYWLAERHNEPGWWNAMAVVFNQNVE